MIWNSYECIGCHCGGDIILRINFKEISKHFSCEIVEMVSSSWDENFSIGYTATIGERYKISTNLGVYT